MLPKPWSTGRVKEGLFSETLDFQSLELWEKRFLLF
jgi:hypothetical protein